MTAIEQLESMLPALAEMKRQMDATMAAAEQMVTRAVDEARRIRTEADTAIAIYDEKETAVIMKTSVSTLSRLRNAKKIKFTRLGTAIRYTAVQINYNMVVLEQQPAQSRRLKAA